MVVWLKNNEFVVVYRIFFFFFFAEAEEGECWSIVCVFVQVNCGSSPGRLSGVSTFVVGGGEGCGG